LSVAQYPVADREHARRSELESINDRVDHLFVVLRRLREVVGKQDLVSYIADQDAEKADWNEDWQEETVSEHHKDLDHDERQSEMH
jgi:hypothetical protein